MARAGSGDPGSHGGQALRRLPEATKRSWELIAQHVMPHFQGGDVSHAQQTLNAKEYAMGKREDYAAAQMQAVATMTERYQQEVAAKKS